MGDPGAPRPRARIVFGRGTAALIQSGGGTLRSLIYSQRVTGAQARAGEILRREAVALGYELIEGPRDPAGEGVPAGD